MPSGTYSFLDIAVLDAVRERFAAGDCLTILSTDLDTVLWANGPGAVAFGYSDIESAIGAASGLGGVARRQIRATAGYPDIGRDKGLVVRLTRGVTSQAVLFKASALTLPDGEKAILLALPAPRSGVDPAGESERLISGLNEPGHFAALVDGNGTVVASSEGFARLGIAAETLTALVAEVGVDSDRLVKRLIPALAGRLPAGLARLADEPATHLLIVVEDAQVAPEPVADARSDVVVSTPPDGMPADEHHWYFGTEREPQKVAEAAPTAPGPPVTPVRFVWRTDAEGRFSMISPEFAQAVGDKAADIVGRRFRDVAIIFGFDIDDEISGLLERRDTWSGRSVLWPVAGTDLKIPVDLAALPVYRRDRTFEGFRGFGVARRGDAVKDPEGLGRALADASQTPAAGAPVETAEAGTLETPSAAPPQDDGVAPRPDGDPFKGEVPALTIVPKPERRFSDKVIRLAEHRGHASERGLSAVERNAFREIGDRLKIDQTPETAQSEPAAGTAGETAAPPIDGAAEPPAALPPTAEDPLAAPTTPAPPVRAEDVDPAPAASAPPDAALPRDPSAIRPWAPVADDAPPSEIEPVSGLGPTAETTGDGARAEPVAPAVEDASTPVAEASQAAPGTSAALDAGGGAVAARIVDDSPVAANEGPAADGSSSAETPAGVAGPAEADPSPRIRMEPVPTLEMAPEDAAQPPDLAPPAALPATGFLPSAFAPEGTAGAADTSLLARLPIPVLIHSGDVLHFANDEFLALSGYPSVEALAEDGGLGQLFGEPYPAEEGDRKLRLLTRSGSEQPVDGRLQSVPWKGGRALLLTLQPSAAPAGADDRLMAERAAEIAAAERAEIETRIAEMRAIVDTATDGVVLITRDGLIRSISRPAEALFGFDSEAVVGQPFVSLFAIESQRSARDYLSGLTEHGVASVLNDGREVIGREAQGRFIPLFMTIGRLPNESGFCAVVRDITQWKRAEEELTQSRAQAERASSQKTDFLARVSHEIRTPLNAIIGFSELMIDEKFGPIGNDRYRDYLRDINRSGNHVLDLVNDLLDISKIEAGEQEMAYEAVSLNDTLSEIVAMMQPQANRERVIIRSSFASRLPEVVADLRSVRQIALNLLSNAVRYTQAGGQVIVSTAYEPSGDVVMRVRDTGVGMTPAEIEQALKPFKQVNTLKRGRHDGTGLGLPLTKAMVEANRAKFSIVSTPGEGTLVEIAFPSTRVLAD